MPADPPILCATIILMGIGMGAAVGLAIVTLCAIASTVLFG